MGFDNECILNIQSLPGEYFCPVCRTLVYPTEALQTQCTHLYCKPCLAYVVATTCACPYDGYLVSEADAKPLIESNKPTAEAIEKIQVHCLYHRSGCQWQGTLSECITHCTSCNFGNSPVVCNRCGTQIIHRQVQEHAQICPGVQPQAQQDSTQSQASAVQNQSVPQSVAAASQEPTSQAVVTSGAVVATATSAPVAAPASAPAAATTIPASSGLGQGQPTVAAQSQVSMQAPTTEQWYQQQQLQYQNYYQQYPGYDPYQQHYQQYGYYQQQAHPQYPQAYVQSHPVQGQQQQQPQVYVQQQPQAPPPQVLAQPLPQPQVQTHPQPVPLGQLPQMQAPTNPQQPVHAHPQQPQMHPSGLSQVPAQPMGQPQTQIPQLQPQSLPQAQPPHLQHQLRPQNQQPVVAQHPPQLQQQQPQGQYQPQPNLHAHTQPPVQQPPLHMQPQPHPRPHSHSLSQPQPQPQPPSQPLNQPPPQPQFQPHPQGQPQPQPQLHPAPAHAVTGHQSFPQPHLHHQTPPNAVSHQRPMHMHPPQQGVSHQQLQHPAQMQTQFTQQQLPPAQMRPPAQMPVQGQQQATMPSMQGPHTHLPPVQQQAHHLVRPSTQQVHQPTGMQAPPQHPSIAHQQAQSMPLHNQLHHQASFPPQQPMPPQQASRAQGPPFVQQPQLQPVSQTAPRPVVLSHTLPQQPFTQSPGGPGIRPQVSSEHKVGSVQFVPTGSQGLVLPSSPTVLNVTMDNKQGDSMSDKMVRGQLEVANDKTDDVPADLREQKPDNTPKYEDNEEKLTDKVDKNVQSEADGESSAGPQKDGVSEGKPIVKEEASGPSEHSPSRVLGDSSVEHNDGEGDTTHETKEIERKSDGCDDKFMHGHAQVVESAKMQMHHDAIRNVKPLGTTETPAQNFVPQGPVYGNERGNVQGPPRQPSHISAPLSHDLSAPPTHDRVFQPVYPDRNMPQFPPQGPVPSDSRLFPPPAQMQPKVLGPPAHHAPMHDQERYTQQAPPHGPQFMQDNMLQRPPAPDRMLSQHMPHLGPNQERMFQEPPPRAMQAPGQPLAPNQMRPSSHHFPENLAHQGQPSVLPDPLQASMVKHPPGSFPGPGPQASLGRGPASFGPPQGSQLPGQGQMLPSNASVVGPRFSQMEPFAGPPMAGPPSGPFDTAAAMNARGPPTDIYANKMPGLFDGRQPDHHQPMPSEHFPPRGMQSGNQSNMMTMNGFPGKGPDLSLSHGSLGERFKPFPEERYKSLAEEGFKPPPDDRFRPYGLDPGRRIIDRRDFEEDLKQFPRPSDLDTEAGLKFENYRSSSRPPLDRSSHALGLDAASRSFDRPMQAFGPEGAPKIGGTSPVPSRLLPLNQSSSHVPVGSGSLSLHPMDTIERQRPLGLHDDSLGRKGDPAHPDFHRPASDFGRLPMDGLHPLRSPGREFTGLPPSRFGSISIGHGLGSQTRLEEFNIRESHAFGDRSKQHNLPSDPIGNPLHENKIPILPVSSGSGILPSHFRRGEADILRMGERSGNLSGHARSGDLDGHDILPSHMRGGDPLGGGAGSFRSHLRLGEISGLEHAPPHLRSRDFPRFGDPAFSSSFPIHGFPSEHGGFNSGSFQGGLDPVDHPRKRKAGNMGWCRLCKIDCETVEGLDLHSQTKEHQKMAMDIVLTIKQDNAKKQKLSSEEHEEANRSRKAGFEGRPSRR